RHLEVVELDGPAVTQLGEFRSLLADQHFRLEGEERAGRDDDEHPADEAGPVVRLEGVARILDRDVGEVESGFDAEREALGLCGRGTKQESSGKSNREFQVSLSAARGAALCGRGG